MHYLITCVKLKFIEHFNHMRFYSIVALNRRKMKNHCEV